MGKLTADDLAECECGHDRLAHDEDFSCERDGCPCTRFDPRVDEEDDDDG